MQNIRTDLDPNCLTLMVFIKMSMLCMDLLRQLTLCLLLSSADNLCKQFGPRSGPTKPRA